MPVKPADAVVARARALVGTRFRPQGRRREHGLDCIGLVAAAAELPVELVPSGYRLRSEVSEDMLSLTLDGRAERIAVRDARAGDVLLVQTARGSIISSFSSKTALFMRMRGWDGWLRPPARWRGRCWRPGG